MNTLQPIPTNKAVIYCRVSTKEQVEDGNSLVSQEKLCREYVDKHNYDLDQIYIEQGESAKTTERPMLQSMLAHCGQKRNGIKAVIIYKVDRLSRKTEDYIGIRMQLRIAGVEIKSVTEFFDNNPAGRFMENIIANVAQFDNDVRTERSVGGMKEAVREGRYVWQAPKGYCNVRVGGKATISPGPLAPLIKELFLEVATSTGHLEDVRLSFIRKGKVLGIDSSLSKPYFYRILGNELYTGKISMFGEEHRGLFEPLVTPEVFAQVQRVVKNRTRRNFQYMTENPDFPLRRFVHAPDGFKLTGSWSRGRTRSYPYYRYHRGKEFRKEWMEENFRIFLDTYAIDTKQFGLFRQRIEKQWNERSIDFERERTETERKLKALEEYQRGLLKKNHERIISDMVLNQELQTVDLERMDLCKTMYALPKLSIKLSDCFETIANYLRKPSKLWDDLSFAGKLKLQWFQFPQGVVFDGEKFGTAKVDCLLRLKEQIEGYLSPLVTSGLDIWNPQEEDKFATCDNITPWELIESGRELQEIMKIP